MTLYLWLSASEFTAGIVVADRRGRARMGWGPYRRGAERFRPISSRPHAGAFAEASFSPG